MSQQPTSKTWIVQSDDDPAGLEDKVQEYIRENPLPKGQWWVVSDARMTLGWNHDECWYCTMRVVKE